MSELFTASPIVRAIGWALLQSLWQGAVIAVVTALSLFLLRRSSASRRYVVSCAGLLTMALAFAGTAIDSGRDAARSARPAAASSAFETVGSARAVQPAINTNSFEPREPEPPQSSWPARLQSWSAALVPLWLAGVAVLSLRFLTGWVLVERIRRAAGLPLPGVWVPRLEAMCRHLRVARPVAILESASVHVPTMIGWLKPVILLPASVLSGLTTGQLEAVIAHELAHVRRHDYAVNVAQSAIEILLFYHPATWWLSRRIRVEREHCCDDIAVEYCGNRLLYAGALAELETVRAHDVALGLAATDGPLLGRVRRLLGPSPGRTPASPLAVFAAIVLTTAIAAFAGIDGGGGWDSAVEAQSATPGEGRKIPPDEGVVQGRVIDAQTGQPVTGARIEVFRDSRSAAPFELLLSVKSMSSGNDGRFEIEAMAPGEYLMLANAPGYVETTYGDLTRNAASGVSVRTSGGRITSGVELRLRPSGIISGRVFADSGEGLPGVEIEILRDMRLPGFDGPRAVGFAQTEEGGAFRVRGLQPGEYYVRAYISGSIRPTRGEPSATYTSTYYPDATRVDDAQRVLVQGGQERVGVDFTLATAKLHLVSGRLIDPSTSVANVGVVLHSMTGAGPDTERATTRVAADGRFVFRDIAPGRYMLMVNDQSNFRRWLGAVRGVDVTAEDITGLDIVAAQPTHMDARLVRDGGAPLPFDPARVGVTIEQRTQGMSFMSGIGPNGRIQPDGTFSIEAGTGTAWVQVSGLPSHWIVKSIALDGADVTDQEIELGAGARRRLDITLTDRVSGITGTVTDPKNRPASMATVLVFPEDRSRWDSKRLVKSAQVRFQGRFRVDDLPAGTYRILAADSLPDLVPGGAELLDRLWPLTTSVRLNDGEQRTLALKLVSTAGVIEP